jgi:hypothetical protein
MPSLATFLFLAAGAFVLLDRPDKGLLAALIAVGAIAGMGRVLANLNLGLRTERVVAALWGAVIGGGTIYLMSQAGGVLGWVILALSLLLGTTLVYILLPAGAFVLKPMAALLASIGRWKRAEERRPHLFAVVIAVALALALALSFATGPGKLPGVALGSSLVLRMERAAAIFAALLLVFTVLAQAWKGILPSEISSRGVRFEQVKDTTQATLGGLETANERFTVSIAQSRENITSLEKRLGQLSDEVDALRGGPR